MPSYQSIKGRKYEYAEEPPSGFKPLTPGKFPLFDAKDFGDIVGNAQHALLKRHARILHKDNLIQDKFGDTLRQFLNSIEPGDLLQPVKILKAGTNRLNPPSARGGYVIAFDNGVSILAKSLEAVLNHPTMTIHGISESGNVSLMVEGKVVGVVSGAEYTPEHAVTIWEAPEG